MKTKTYKTFRHISKLLKTERRMLDAKRGGLGQSKLSAMIGSPNGQYISNIERGECGLAAKHASKVAMILGISIETIAQEAAKDFYESYITEANRHEVKITN